MQRHLKDEVEGTLYKLKRSFNKIFKNASDTSATGTVAENYDTHQGRTGQSESHNCRTNPLGGKTT
jgi:hypothetical protein